VSGDEVASLCSRRFHGTLGRATPGLKEAMARHANLADLDVINVSALHQIL
jgi:tRNA U54 and U55 pseudouridine synthase Pus10